MEAYQKQKIVYFYLQNPIFVVKIKKHHYIKGEFIMKNNSRTVSILSRVSIALVACCAIVFLALVAVKKD